jgi:hypothetical protein
MEEIELKGGVTTTDPRLDRVPQFDPRSRAFGIAELTTVEELHSKTWRCLVWNDQGREGACVGFAWSHELSATPTTVKTTNEDALAIYKTAQTLDEWPGTNYSGTSVLAGAKAVQRLSTGGKSLMPEYRWAFGVDDLILALGNHGPAVLGINWHEGMYNTDESGFIHPTGKVVGGHAILCRAVKLTYKAGTTGHSLDNIDRDKSFFTLRNSWGKDWGRVGDCYVTINDMDTLLRNGGEACVPVVRKSATVNVKPVVDEKPTDNTPGDYFITNKYSMTFHKNHPGLDKKIVYKTRAEAIGRGRFPCPVCNP